MEAEPIVYLLSPREKKEPYQIEGDGVVLAPLEFLLTQREQTDT